MKKTWEIALSAVLLSFVVYGCTKSEPTDTVTRSEQGSQAAHTDHEHPEAPDFTLTDHNGNTHRLSDYKGKIIVLEWINPECPFVARHYQEGTMVDLARTYANRDVVWLAMNSTSHFDQEKNKAFAETHDLPYPVLDDSDGTVGRLYKAKTTPHMFVIDKAGRIAYDGAIDDDPQGSKASKTNYVKDALDALLDNRPVQIAQTKPYGCSVKYAD